MARRPDATEGERQHFNVELMSPTRDEDISLETRRQCEAAAGFAAALRAWPQGNPWRAVLMRQRASGRGPLVPDASP